MANFGAQYIYNRFTKDCVDSNLCSLYHVTNNIFLLKMAAPLVIIVKHVGEDYSPIKRSFVNIRTLMSLCTRVGHDILVQLVSLMITFFA